jgi:hypothetical protein
MAGPLHRLRLFVSAATELEAEHEAIGQAVARIPVPSLGWDDITGADFFVLLLGRDVQAPVGAELLAARRAGKRALAYRKDVQRTQAAAGLESRIQRE